MSRRYDSAFMFLGAFMLLMLSLSCAPESRDRWMNFFFEIPKDENGEAVAVRAEVAPDVPRRPVPRATPTKPEVFASVHEPWMKRDCTECHDQTEQMQVPEDTTDWCIDCHADYFDEDRVGHAPVFGGECSFCHVPHRSEFPHLLSAPANTSCVDCHEEAEDLSEAAHGGADGPNCVKCHDPHFGEPPLLRAGIERPAGEDEDESDED